jgi:hypothetical protein
MSLANPDKALAALVAQPIEALPGVEVRPITLGMFAVLEKIRSPLVTGEGEGDALSALPTLYVLTHGPAEYLRGNLLEKAIEWADALPVDALAKIEEAAARQMEAVFGAAEGEKKTASRAATTAG